MREPVTSGGELLAEMAYSVEPGTVRLFPLGQSGVVARFAGGTVALDLYLSSHLEAVIPRPFDHRRLTRAPLDASELTDLDAVLCSHEHLDHFDVPTIRTLRDASPHSVAVVPAAMASQVIDLDWPRDRVRATRGGDQVEVAGLTIVAFGVPHEQYDVSEDRGHRFQGYVVDDGTVSLAHVGDSLADERLAETLALLAPDILCLPINGRDEHRQAMGFAGNMTAEEAVDLAVSAGVSRVLPIHDDMFAQNIDPGARERFSAAAARRGITVVRPPVGGSADVTRAS